MKVLPLYLPHQGCTHQCVYCNQPLVVGSGENRENWRERLESFFDNAVLNHERQEWEIAFFGGTFSALDPKDMNDCMQVVAPYVKKPGVLGLRISTRPDRVSDDTLEFLKSAGVRTIELGVESLDDFVLRKSARGHSANDVRDACGRIKRYDFQLGVHLMCGLPGQAEESFFQTVRESLPLNPDFVRIAPTLVLRGTPLEKLYQRGDYHPISLEEALHQCAYAYRVFHRNSIAVARLGLAISDADGDGMDKLVAGPWHPAFRHEVESRLVRETIAVLLKQDGLDAFVTIHPKDISIVLGEGKKNLEIWKKCLHREFEIVRDINQPRHSVKLSTGRTYSLFDPTIERNQ